jgi:hypothetical protein
MIHTVSLGVKVTETGCTPKLMKKEFNEVMRNAWRITGTFYHSTFIAKHFTHRGATEYGYKPRVKGYEMKKLKAKGHTYPLVWSGESKQQALVKDIKENPKGVRITINAPHLEIRHRKSPINMVREMTTVSQAEIAELQQVFAEAVEVEFNSMERERGLMNMGKRNPNVASRSV